MAVSKKLRFEVFRRDNFACRYCGATAQSGAVLEADHVVPKSRGGRDLARNLVTACEGCNSGKSDTPLSKRTVEDVPQELFARTREQRGLARASDEDSVLETVLHYMGDDRDGLLKESRDELREIYDGEPTSEAVTEAAASNFVMNQVDEIWRLQKAVDDLMYLHPKDRDVAHESAVLALSVDGQGETVAGSSRFVIEMARWFCQYRDDEILRNLPDGHLEEWNLYALALLGSAPWGPGDAWGENEIAKKAAYAIRIHRAGHIFTEMCHAAGRHIAHCPRRGKEVIWLEGCRHCHADSPTADAGHLVCADHLEQIQQGTYIGARTGEPLTLSRHTPLHASEREHA